MRITSTDYSDDSGSRAHIHKAWILWTGDEDHTYHHRVEVHIARRWRTRIGAAIRFDSEHAETPVDVDAHAGPISVFFSTSAGRRVNRWLRVESGASREIGAEAGTSRDDGNLASRLTHATLRWSLWTDPEHQVLYSYRRRQLSRWYVARRGYVHPIGATLDRVLGRVDYTVEKLATAHGIAWLPEGGYPLHLALERR